MPVTTPDSFSSTLDGYVQKKEETLVTSNRKLRSEATETRGTVERFPALVEI